MGPMTLRHILRHTLLLALVLAGPVAVAADANHGHALYDGYCRGCHGFPPTGGPETAAGNPAKIRAAISGGVPTMGFLRGFFSNSDIDDIAAYLAALASSGPIVPTLNYTDMWWGGESESGWGFNVFQHASNNIFGIMYTYDETGKRVWFLLPGGTWTTPTTFTGTWYRSAGPPYSAAFKPNEVLNVGTATIVFQSANDATLTFSVLGVPATKIMTRLQY